MRADNFRRAASVLATVVLILAVSRVFAESAHGIAMYGEPALPPDFVSLPYVNPDAPKGGRIVFGNTGGFDSLNPFVIKGTPPWQWRFLGYESLLSQSLDEPFTLYGLLAESVETPADRSWVEFSLRPEARFSDGSPVTVEDVIWSFETLGAEGHMRYRSLPSKIDRITQTGPRSLRIDFNTPDRELPLIAGLRPVLKKAQWDGRSFADAQLSDIPIGSGPYIVASYEGGRRAVLRRSPDYWGKDLPLRRGTMNFEEIQLEFFADATVLFEAFKAGDLSVVREDNAERWSALFDFPAVASGQVVKSEIRHGRPTGMTGFVFNTRRPPLDDWRVRQALLLAFNFEYVNETATGGVQPRITSYFANSDLGMSHGPATGKVRALLEPFAADLPPGALDGYTLPVSDGTLRNRGNLRDAAALLDAVGLKVGSDGRRLSRSGDALTLTVLIRQGDTRNQSIMDIYRRALDRLGIELRIERVDNAQFVARETAYDFDITSYRRDMSLSPGNEQRLYWGSQGVSQPGTRNLMGMDVPAAEAMIDAMVSSATPEDFTAAVRALDRILMAGRYVIPLWYDTVDRIAHRREFRYPARTPVYGDRPGFLPEVWWYQPD